MSAVEPTVAPATVKQCCAALYEQDWLGLLLGEHYHPGGAELTRRLGELLRLAPGDRVLDVASGPGSSALLLAREFGVRAYGVDLALGSVLRARAQASESGLEGRVGFAVGDAERLAVGSASVDAIVCECSLCTFPDKPAALTEFARVLRRGGRVGIADVVLDPGRLDPELRTLVARIACLADARPLPVVVSMIQGAGLRVTAVESHDVALAVAIDRIEARLALLSLLRLPALEGVDFIRARELAARAGRMAREGVAGYALVTAEAA